MRINIPINFYEIDSNGNHVVRITGGDEVSKQKRENLIRASEDMYEALKYIIRELDKADIIKANSIFMELPNKAIAKAEGR